MDEQIISTTYSSDEKKKPSFLTKILDYCLALKISVIVCYVLLITMSCSQKYNVKTTGTIDAPINFKDVILELEKIVDEDELRAGAHLKLSELYFNCTNPNKNYTRALDELEKYIKLKPENSNTYEIQNLLAILRELRDREDKLRQLQRKMDQLLLLEIQLEDKRKKIKEQ